ncbi:MAG: DUF6797 domain-containing protein [Isosphaeraceae bacterium]
MHPLPLLLVMSISSASQPSGVTPPGNLDVRLRSESPESLARDARRLGDARRGAAVFHTPTLTCVKCHLAERGAPTLGPDLAAIGKDVADSYLVESILEPSKAIKKGYETVTLSTEDGRTLAGLLVEDRADAVVLRDPGQDGKAITIAKGEIEERRDGGASIMPAGLANNLASREQFLDLVRYLMEIAEHGPARALALRPDPGAIATAPLPPGDRDIDHAGMIRDLGQASYERGEAIYNRVCVNCHGTKERPGSLPTSLRFASGSFKNGSDPFSLYRTLSLGFGQMTPQTWMVPKQKYDVIHYIREAFLKPHNPGQYARIDPDYLARLPRGTGRGPDPVEIQPWVTMDYGPSLAATYEVSAGDRSNIACKGIAVRLDPGSGGVSRGRAWAVYDEDTLRLAACWTGQGFIDWNGINFNGSHAVHPRLVGTVELANPNEPAWANPATGGFDDLRIRGRDGKPYGPLPRDWLRYRGLHAYGDRTILAYAIGRAEILETPGLEHDPAHADRPIFTRTLNVGRSDRDLKLRVAPAGIAVVLAGDTSGGVQLGDSGKGTVLEIPAAATPVRLKPRWPAATWVISPAGRLPGGPPAADPAAARPDGRSGSGARGPSFGDASGPFAVDVLGVPAANPGSARCARLRLPGQRPARRGLHLGRRRLARRGNRPPGEGPDLATDRLRALPAAGPEGRRGRDLRWLPRPDRPPPRPQRRRRGRFLRVLQQRPPGHRALPRIRDGFADRSRGEFLLREGRVPRTARHGAASRDAPEGGP